jgi:tetratricopeptide (TPR) repeat protein
LRPLPANGVLIGIALVFVSSIFYFFRGFNPVVFLVWLAGLFTCGWDLFSSKATSWLWFSRRDGFIALILFIAALPIYVWSVYTIPWQALPDEASLISWEQIWVHDGVVDPFGISEYFGFPNFPYLVLGWVGNFLGGIDLYHERLLSGICAAAIVACSYIFYRALATRCFIAVTAAILLAFNHSFIAIGRLAFKDNGAVLYEVLALAPLFYGFKHRCLFTTYIGGILAGLSLYQYYPARIVIPIWLAFLLGAAIFKRMEYPWPEVKRMSLTFCLGLLLAGLPLAAASLSNVQSKHFQYQQNNLLIFPEGRQMQMHWVGAKTVAAGFLINVIHGLTMFNNAEKDSAGQYHNPGFGFVDPITGILTWIGFLTNVAFRRRWLPALMMILSLTVQILCFSFLVGKTPDYTRLLVILPFAALFAAQGIEALALLAAGCFASRSSAALTMFNCIWACFLILIVMQNLLMYRHYLQTGFDRGDDVGGLARYVEERHRRPNYLFIVAASKKYPFFNNDNPGAWIDRVTPFLSVGQENTAISPDDISTMRLAPPFTVFMNADLWSLNRNALQKIYPKAISRQIYKAKGLVAFEEPTASAHDDLHSCQFVSHRDQLMTEIAEIASAGNDDKTIAACKRILARTDLALNGSVFKAQILHFLAMCYLHQRQDEKAKASLLETMQLEAASDKDIDWSCGDWASVLGNLFVRENQLPEAEHWYRRALEIRATNETGSAALTQAEDYRNLAETCWKQGHLEDAQVPFAKAHELFAKQGSPVEQSELSKEIRFFEESRLGGSN